MLSTLNNNVTGMDNNFYVLYNVIMLYYLRHAGMMMIDQDNTDQQVILGIIIEQQY